MKKFSISAKSIFTPIYMGQVPVPYGEYTCEVCGGYHKTRCDTCDLPPLAFVIAINLNVVIKA